MRGYKTEQIEEGAVPSEKLVIWFAPNRRRACEQIETSVSPSAIIHAPRLEL